ncbi:Di-copper centre-containing protein [Conidiobolus coronatus NRRL 28638]|uniref:Di-copper centre-containing protein n=1 Tax=Conidiobolus coronatus (strain ATCC 28846 / CBS 209.66 / NRRL 28638) TaxID=796925 RepID=A0A137NZ43_CONC2|nr:Di-copper centre-containing protein [Conidiobolus coronatus NRRL 28638]|eukprot:KXN67968.1 Di-copper centre-containing protein [Conidiobolus coronatus NRRL 28638]
MLVCFNVVASAKCSQPRIRKEIREMSPDEVSRLKNAFQTLHDTPGSRGIGSVMDEFTQTHSSLFQLIHNGPEFFPWHRKFLRLFELELQKVDSSINLPYWDWTLDNEAPAQSIVLSNDYFGGNGDPMRNNCMTTGPWANWHTNWDTPHCLRRIFSNSVNRTMIVDGNMGVLPSDEVIDALINDSPQFSRFSNQFEDFHTLLHLYIGGMGGDMSQGFSPNDPIFYLHHGLVDWIWWEWQRRHPDVPQYDGLAFNRTTTLNDLLTQLGDPVFSTLDTEEEYYCYTYSTDFPKNPEKIADMVQAASVDLINDLYFDKYSSDEINKRYERCQQQPNRIVPDELKTKYGRIPSLEEFPDHYIQMMGRKREDMDQVISYSNNIATKLNFIRGY